MKVLQSIPNALAEFRIHIQFDKKFLCPNKGERDTASLNNSKDLTGTVPYCFEGQQCSSNSWLYVDN